MTVEEFWAFSNRPENADRNLELIRGEVVEWPISYHKHGFVCAQISVLLEEYARLTRTGYVVGANAGVILPRAPQSVVGPDVAYFTHGDGAGELEAAWSESLPVLAVEVLAPNEDAALVAVKVEEYVRNGVEFVWLIDYEKKNVSVYRPGRAVVVVDGASELLGEENLSGLSIRVASLFQLPGERRTQLGSPAS